ncbi:hypothetical protein [Paenibacillus sp. Lou8.1]|nr:hypothetical protein [Paenibacillus sp. Lou8.1]
MAVSLVYNDLLECFKELLDVTENELNIISPFMERKPLLYWQIG